MFDNVDDIDDSLSTTSRFFVVNELDDAFDAAENDDGDIDEDKFVDDRENTVDGVESNECDTTTDEPTTLAMVCFFFFFCHCGRLTVFCLRWGAFVVVRHACDC